LPFVFSVESLEDHRSPNASTSYNLAIKSIEWLGFFEAEKIVVKSEWMKDEVTRIYNVPKDKIFVITPGDESWIRDMLQIYNCAVGGKKLEA
jgi:hypothetical protein